MKFFDLEIGESLAKEIHAAPDPITNKCRLVGYDAGNVPELCKKLVKVGGLQPAEKQFKCAVIFTKKFLS